MGFATVISGGLLFFVMLSMVVTMLDVQDIFVENHEMMLIQQERLKQALSSQVEINASSVTWSGAIGNRVWVTTTTDDFMMGNFSDTHYKYATGEITLNKTLYENYTLSGTYTSEILDAGSPANYTILNFTGSEPATTSIVIQLRSGETVSDLYRQDFVGPDNTTGTFYLTNGTINKTGHAGHQFMQFRATLTTLDNTTTPRLEEVNITVQRFVDHNVFEVVNTGSEPIDPETIDIYLDNTRMVRNLSEVQWVLSDNQFNKLLWDPGEILNVTIFQNTSAGTHTFGIAAEGDAQDTLTAVKP